ncbi:MAG: type I-F CRISPR-associated endoribonuclease Cas6/Csy4 [Oleiphilus sp.]
MNSYIDIEVKPDAEMRENVLMNKVYTKLHKTLCDSKAIDIGVSFPRYKVMLGKILRVHSTAERLSQLQESNWLGGLSGYCEVSGVQTVPDSAKYRIVSRIQSNMSKSKLNRLIKRRSISESEIKSYKAKMFSVGLDNPYLELESGSNGFVHRRYIKFGVLMETPITGSFDQFGLSKDATIPWF